MDNLPEGLEVLNCSGNILTHLDKLPKSLKELFCCSNKITQLDNLPESIEEIYCYYNQITQLNNLPKELHILICNDNQITHFNYFPPKFHYLNCNANPLVYYSQNYFSSNSKYYYNIDIIRSINRFRFAYYTGKFSKRIEQYYLKWRMNKIKEELIAEAMHPRRIGRLLEMEDDLENV
jgi:hypothetical protein